MVLPIPQKRQHIFTPADWYWLAEDGRVYASARDEVVTQDDQAFIDWMQAGHKPTTWPRDDAGAQADAVLHEVLRPHGLGLEAAKATALADVIAWYEAMTFAGHARQMIGAAKAAAELPAIVAELKSLFGNPAPKAESVANPARRAAAKRKT